MFKNLPLPTMPVFGLRGTRFALYVFLIHFGLQLGLSRQKQSSRRGYHGFLNLLWS